MTIDPRFGLTERTWPSVIQTPISITGWKVTVATTAGIKVKQDATLSKPGQESLDFEVKRVLNRTELLLGNKGQGQPAVSGITQFDGGTLIINEQSRNKLGDSPILRAVYEEEPTIAIRTVMVDQFGEKYSDTNPLPVAVDVSLDTVQLLDKPYDSGTETYPLTTREVVTTYIGGLSGTPVQRVTLNYFDATKERLIDWERETWNGVAWVVG
jgi:hypothetical protein